MATSSHEYSSRPLLSTRSFSGSLSPSKAPPRSPPPSPLKFKVPNRLRRPHKGLLFLLACVFGVAVVSFGFGEDGEGWYSWRSRTRSKASQGLIKSGGRRGRNESCTGEFRLEFSLGGVWLGLGGSVRRFCPEGGEFEARIESFGSFRDARATRLKLTLVF